jgi:hypothetical protein
MVVTCCALLGGGGAMAAGVHKCAGAGGTPLYQQVPCAPGTELRDLGADPPTLSVVPGVPLGSAPAASAAAGRVERTRRASEPPRARRSAAHDGQSRRFVRAGMSEGEVLAQLGRPDARAGAGSKGRTRWTYLPTAGDAQTLTLIIFERGVVADVERKVVRP